MAEEKVRRSLQIRAGLEAVLAEAYSKYTKLQYTTYAADCNELSDICWRIADEHIAKAGAQVSRE